jgi:hypothetical protein
LTAARSTTGFGLTFAFGFAEAWCFAGVFVVGCAAADAFAAQRPQPAEHDDREHEAADRGDLDRGRERERHSVPIGTSNE